MSEIIFECKINGRARSKKNSKQILRSKSGKPFIASSNEYKKWAFFASQMIRLKWRNRGAIEKPCNLTVICTYKNHQHEQDLENIISSISDVLEDCGVIKNDKLFYSYDGSRKIFDDSAVESVYFAIKYLD
jgi:Holliday junction resolvase RusA-like endonuclease